MDLNRSILEDIREAVGLSRDTEDFDSEIAMHINVALGILNQNGIGNPIVVSDTVPTWNDLRDPIAVKGNELFHMIPAFIKLHVKMIFDPPPPSAVEYHSQSIDQILWRLNLAYETASTTSEY